MDSTSRDQPYERFFPPKASVAKLEPYC